MPRNKVDTITAYLNGALVRTYQFGYTYLTPAWHVRANLSGAQSPGLAKLVLSSVQEQDADGSTVLPGTGE